MTELSLTQEYNIPKYWTEYEYQIFIYPNSVSTSTSFQAESSPNFSSYTKPPTEILMKLVISSQI